MPSSHYILLQEDFLESWQICYIVFSLRSSVLHLLVARESLLTFQRDPTFLFSFCSCVWAPSPVSQLHMIAHAEVPPNTLWSWGISGCLGKEAVSIRFQSSSPLGSASLTREERCQVHLVLSLVNAAGHQTLPEEWRCPLHSLRQFWDCPTHTGVWDEPENKWSQKSPFWQ